MAADFYGVIVIGGGHAGCEAALACARMGVPTLMIAMQLDSIAMMPCNPSIGGTGKGHLVREIDALGGQMAKTIDETYISARMLNASKGPAVHSLRAQADKRAYHDSMKLTLERTGGLWIKQDEAVEVITSPQGAVCGVTTRSGLSYSCAALIVAAGTYLDSRVFYGKNSWQAGPSGLSGAGFLSGALERLGITLARLKTGTPARLERRSVDFSKLEVQRGDDPCEAFSFDDAPLADRGVPCHVAYTNENTHRIIRENLHLSAMYSGLITGTGPRYCPSIEDKVVRFADKERHQVFVEPEGESTDEVYLQGMSSSLPPEVQLEFIRSMVGFENAAITRPAYAIEYDAIDPRQLSRTLACRSVPGLYFAGQINGTSGYEEAACQGIIAGINAAAAVKGLPALTLGRQEAYIGVLIDDITSKGAEEPYRIMTSRVEHRLLCRQDNADLRLTPVGRFYGLIPDGRWAAFEAKRKASLECVERLREARILPGQAVRDLAEERGFDAPSSPVSAYELLKRPRVEYGDVKTLAPQLPDDGPAARQAQIGIKYADYIAKAEAQARRTASMEAREIPAGFDYASVANLRLEARDKLEKVRPESVGQASRIPGVSPADVSSLVVGLQRFLRKGEEA